MITNIGTEVAAVVAEKSPGMATTIVGITSAALKSMAGSNNINPVLESFKDTFKTSINDPVIQGKLDTVLSQIIAGTSDKNITPLETPINNKTEEPKSQSDPTFPTGPIINPETQVKNT